MKKTLFTIFLSFLFVGTSFASHANSLTPTTSYYIGDVSECRYMLEYTCEHGYQKFSDNKGCGCSVGATSSASNQYYVPQNSTPQQYYYTGGNSYYNTKNYSTRTASITSNLRYCGTQTQEVCGAPKNTCTGSNCAILHPRTYNNICQLEAVEAQYISRGECPTYTRNLYSNYTSQHYRNDYQTTDEDYLMYLVNEFIYDMERKNYSDNKIITTIDRVIKRLENLGDESSRYQNAIRDAIWELERYKDRYEDEDAYEKIENIFERY